MTFFLNLANGDDERFSIAAATTVPTAHPRSSVTTEGRAHYLRLEEGDGRENGRSGVRGAEA